MKVERQDDGFRPVHVVLESELEVDVLRAVLDTVTSPSVCGTLTAWSREHNRGHVAELMDQMYARLTEQ